METSSEARYVTLGTEAHQDSALLLSWSHAMSCPWAAQLSEGAPTNFSTPIQKDTSSGFQPVLFFIQADSSKAFL